jgi:hypothetical protein
MESRQISSGLPGLDFIVGGVLAGDNIVWQVDEVDDIRPFIVPFCRFALSSGKKLVYFRFAKHPPLVPKDVSAEIHHLNPEEGFETFLFKVHTAIAQSGRGAYYVLDCLSELVADWYSDQMLANFFMLTCPYLYDMETVAYFVILRNRHSNYATAPITETTQLFFDLYRYDETTYVRPLKVLHRYSPTMYMLHAWKGEDFLPVSESVVISEILSSVPRTELGSGGVHLDVWNRAFAAAQFAWDSFQSGKTKKEDIDRFFKRLLRMAISRNERILALCEIYFRLDDILQIGRRSIGTGLIGGKSVGMLLARKILESELPQWKSISEMHDSFYIASDVFYTYLVRNGCWWVRAGQRSSETFLRGSPEARRQILRGTFPDFLVKQFSEMLDYFGQSPIIVRSSSLLEDNFGNAFAGKYESVFLANQGPRGKRLEDFMSAARTIYSSTMSEGALKYRARRGLLDHDEQMALLVQRVSGSQDGSLFYPHLAGVGFSHNSYAWDESIDPEAGVMRLVLGLGTRAVDRSDDDYTRLVALNEPKKRPELVADELSQFAQHKVDVLALRANQLTSMDFPTVVKRSKNLPLDKFASRNTRAEHIARKSGDKNTFPWLLTLDGVIDKTPFVNDIRMVLKVLRTAYDYPVDIEFAANFLQDGSYRFNLLQCRPLQVHGGGIISDPPDEVLPEDLVLQAEGAVIGQSRLERVDRLIFVVPFLYGQLPIRERHSIARLVGRITRLDLPAADACLMLLGPGRWGTTTPSLGVPVSFGEISRASIICEIVAMREDLIPDVSLGTHFFSDLVEMDILYMALFPERQNNSLNEQFFLQSPNKLSDLLPNTPAEHAEVVRVIDVEDLPGNCELSLYANTLKQTVVCYLDHVSSKDSDDPRLDE